MKSCRRDHAHVDGESDRETDGGRDLQLCSHLEAPPTIQPRDVMTEALEGLL